MRGRRGGGGGLEWGGRKRGPGKNGVREEVRYSGYKNLNIHIMKNCQPLGCSHLHLVRSV